MKKTSDKFHELYFIVQYNTFELDFGFSKRNFHLQCFPTS